jgi:hypothetical protein
MAAADDPAPAATPAPAVTPAAAAPPAPPSTPARAATPSPAHALRKAEPLFDFGGGAIFVGVASLAVTLGCGASGAGKCTIAAGVSTGGLLVLGITLLAMGRREIVASRLPVLDRIGFVAGPGGATVAWTGTF